MTPNTSGILARAAALLCLAAIAFGCANTSARRGPHQKPRPALQVAEVRGAVAAFTPEMRALFTSTLEQELYAAGGFPRGNQVTLEWQTTFVDRGSRALRYLVGFGAGAGSFVVKARLLDAKGGVIATKEVQGKQVMGFGGGSFDSAIEEAAEDLADFALETL